MSQLCVVHACKAYLPASENWLYHLIEALPDAMNMVASPLFLPSAYYSPRTHYLMSPIQPLNRDLALPDTFVFRTIERLGLLGQRFYPQFAAAAAGHTDIVHSHFGHVGWQFRPLAQQLGVPHVISFYGLDFRHLLTVDSAWSGRYSQLFAESAAFVVQGSHGVDILTRMGCPRRKIAVVPLGVATNAIDPVVRPKVAGELALLQAADFREKKGHIDTVSAFLRAVPASSELTLTLVGSEPSTRASGLRRQVHDLVVAAGAEARVSFIDRLPHADLLALMSRHHVFIQPSHESATGDMEGGPVSVLDAQATGMPVIATFHGDLPRSVLHGTTGLLSKERDVEGLAAAISRFYTMGKEEYARFSERARSHVVENYDVGITARAMRTMYDRIIRGLDPAGET